MKSSPACVPSSPELASPCRYSPTVRQVVKVCRGVAVVVLGAACVLTGCSRAAPESAAASDPPPAAAPAATAAPAAPPYHLVASIREVMNSIIDPNIDVVWNSVRTVIDHGKPIDYAPANDEEWAAVRHSALTVIEGANLLMMPGRAVAPPGAGSLSPGIELAPDEIRALIDGNRAGWNQFARALQNSVEAAMVSIDKKDAQGLFDAGDEIDEVCEGCHQIYWYPQQGVSAAAR